MTDQQQSITWTYTGDGEVHASGGVWLAQHTQGVLRRAIAALDPTEEALQALLEKWWDKPFTLTVTYRVEGDEAIFGCEVEDHDDMRGPVVVLAYILIMEANAGNANELKIVEVQA